MPHPSRDEDGREETGEEALIRELAEKQITVPTASEAECRRYYDHNQQRFRSADIYEASHILIATPPDDEKRHAKLKGKAAELCEILRRDPAQFEVLAGQHSECPSAGAGGNLGQISPGTTVAEFEDALIAMTPGTIGPEPIETRYGFHIVRLDKRIEGRLMPFEMVQERIASYLDERATRLATAQYLALIASRSRIEGVDLPMPSDVGALPQ
jgi:peptidyl-prolyl cis-trans isomerase C